MNESKNLLLRELDTLQFKMMRFFKKAINPLDMTLSPIQMFTMCFIAENNNPTISDIAQNNQVSLPTQTQQIDRLVELQLLERLNDPNDRRVIRLQITEKGLDAIKTVHHLRTKALTEIMDVLSEKELEDFNNAIKKVIVKLEKKYGEN